MVPSEEESCCADTSKMHHRKFMNSCDFLRYGTKKYCCYYLFFVLQSKIAKIYDMCV